MAFHGIDSFPQLAWCVRLRRASSTALVLHGRGVEVRPDAFFEGAWNGRFEAGNFDEAETFVGSGARVGPDAITFVAPTQLAENVYSIQVGDEMFVSNSIACALVQAGEELDPSYRDYYFDLLDDYRAGISRPFKSIRTRGGRRVFFHTCANVVVGNDLVPCRVEKRVPAPPPDFAGYVAHLEGTLARLFENAATSCTTWAGSTRRSSADRTTISGCASHGVTHWRACRACWRTIAGMAAA
jgi:hypothetical protein